MHCEEQKEDHDPAHDEVRRIVTGFVAKTRITLDKP